MTEKITQRSMSRREFGGLAGVAAAVSSGIVPGFARLAFAEESVAQIEWPLRLSSAGTYLEDQMGRPYQLNIDAGWELTTQISNEDAILYLDDRLSKGFNGVEIRVIGQSIQTNAPNNYYGEAPFTNGSTDWSVRNEAYWSRVDAILTAMRDRGMVALMFPAYLGFNCGDDGWCQQMLVQTDAVMTDYGVWIGDRYKDYGNIIWMTGGDSDASAHGDAQARNHAVVAGVRQSYPDALFGAEPQSGQIAGIDSYQNTIDINCVYEYSNVVSAVQRAYANGGPFMLQESTYENEHGSTVILQKSIALVTLLGGGLIGQVFGSCPLWNFGANYRWCDGSGAPFDSWQYNLDSPGSIAVGNIGKLMRSRKWWTLVPDYANEVMTNSKGSGDVGYHATAREASGETVMVWAPNRNKITIDMTKVSGSQAMAWWWNPSDNSSTEIGTFPTEGKQTFTPRAWDRVLVLDDSAAGLAAPGTTVYV
jgi:hypothetical protein